MFIADHRRTARRSAPKAAHDRPVCSRGAGRRSHRRPPGSPPGPPTRRRAGVAGRPRRRRHLERPRDDLVARATRARRRHRSSRRRPVHSPTAATVEPIADTQGDGAGARRRRTAGRSRGSRWLFALPLRWTLARRGAATDATAADARHRHAVVGAARPPRPAQRSACSACWPRRRCPRRSSTRCSPRRSSSPPTTSASATAASASPASIVRAGIILVLPVAAFADRIGRRRVVTAMASPRRSSPPPARSPRRSRSSSPPRPSAARSAWRSTSWSPSSPPRRCRATAGPTRSACWRWPAGSAPASPSWPCRSPTSRPARGACVYVVALIWLRGRRRHRPPPARDASASSAPTSWRRRLDRRRFAVLAGVALLANLFVAPASLFQNGYLKDVRGFSAHDDRRSSRSSRPRRPASA